MRIHVLAIHPNPEQSRVTAAWAEAAHELGHPVHWLTAQSSWNPAEHQANCEQADALLIIHPIHWYSAPWMLKRWIDEVLTFGWAYGDRCALAGKPWVHAISVGAEESEYRRDGSRYYTVEEFLAPLERTAAFVGAKWMPPFLSYGGGIASDEEVLSSRERFSAWLQTAL